MPPKFVERMLYAFRNHPEMGWLEILPPEPEFPALPGTRAAQRRLWAGLALQAARRSAR